MIKDMKAVVGTYKQITARVLAARRLDLQCPGVNIDTASRDRLYLRHFLVPLHRHGVTVNPTLVTPEGKLDSGGGR